MKCVIFLDFDGVMDTEAYDSYLVQNNMPNVDEYGPVFDPECVNTLETILNAIGAQFVVSSTWKEFMTLEEIREMWKKRNLPGYILDVTPNVNPHFRGDEINAWLESQEEGCLHAIIDDLDASQFTEEQLAFFVQTNPWCGIDEETGQRVLYLMRREITAVLKETCNKQENTKYTR